MVAYMGIGNREQEMVPLMFDNHKVSSGRDLNSLPCALRAGPLT